MNLSVAKLPANAYGIGPSWYDWRRERDELQDLASEADNAEFEHHFEWWRIGLYCDRGTQDGQKEIAETFGLAMNDLYNNEPAAKKFEAALFEWYCSGGDSRNATQVIHELLDRYLRAVVRKEWEKSQEKEAA